MIPAVSLKSSLITKPLLPYIDELKSLRRKERCPASQAFFHPIFDI